MKTYLILKKYCRYIYLLGSGNFWFNQDTGNDSRLAYKIYSFSVLFMYILWNIMEVLAAVFVTNDEEGFEVVTFAFSHTIVMIKILSLVFKKKMLRKLNWDVCKACEMFEESHLMEKKYKSIVTYTASYFIIVNGTTVFYIVDAINRMIAGSHFVVIATYYPTYEDESVLAQLCRILATLLLITLMCTMFTIETCVITHIVIFRYKLITLRQYFERLRIQFDVINILEGAEAAEKALVDGVVEGIVMQVQLLSLLKDIEKAFGFLMAMQVFHSSGAAVTLLLQYALSDELSFLTGVKISLFVLSLFLILSLFLCNAGEITREAARLPEAICFCGWHLVASVSARRKLRTMMLISIAQAQRPLVIKAFKMIELTYGTLLWVGRSTYSVFALVYAQHQ